MPWVFAVLAVVVVLTAWWVGEGHGGELAQEPRRPRRRPRSAEPADEQLEPHGDAS